MLDFTSCLYLGMRHEHGRLRPWRQLTAGRPAALCTSAQEDRVAAALAQFLRCESAALATSTLHIFWDLFDVLASEGIAIHVDSDTYPIARWGVERARAKGIAASFFGTGDLPSLSETIERTVEAGLKPVVVTDGVCSFTGRPAPLPQYAALIRPYDGYLVIDDTQGLGLLGEKPALDAPYGHHGAGTPAWHALAGPEIILVNSLAKGFGAPLAVIGGSAKTIERFKAAGATRVHCSPPSAAALSAAENALALNETEGAARRSRLIELVRCFRTGLSSFGLSTYGGLFPIQTLKWISGPQAIALYGTLARYGVRTVLRGARRGTGAVVSWLINTLHCCRDIATAVQILQVSCRRDFSPQDAVLGNVKME
jgi:8-amino-7-oxononanoate synthase